jgi:CubicO group peptidase (beta-lactamase class C family)
VRKICIKDDNFDPSSVDPSRRRGQICYPDPNSIPQDMILCDLASHSSGLPEEPGLSIFKNNKNPYANFTTEKLNKYVSNLQAIAPFGYEYNHSAIGMALLGEALSVRGNNAFDVLLKEKVLDPLGMRYTFVEPNTTQKRLLMYGHDNKGAGLPHVDYNAMSPAFGVHSNVADLLRFLNANLKQGNTPLSYALHETQSPRIYTNPFNMNYLVGWGWVIVPLEPKNAKNNKKVWWQCGEKSGFASFIGFVKETGVGVVVLSNSTESVDDMSFKILKSLDEYVEKSKTALK